ncbi:peptidoglycan endopeptidase [Sphingomonas sp. S1-29]|uniref:peptidoglycan endopeptidase n=1 Tax=Sphingomonas sp. S1-29 TaxID=2991074 RepID=UPI00223FABF7|nr:peptidoglycan endopeptidase [Sphingomonas sp. S1-29]UZK68669.1 peptidoglycan endopeptidase [Sphingomonas sp. S1-29]
MSAVAAAARELVGARFRLHGRDPATGLDCVGVVAAALAGAGAGAGAGAQVTVPQGYAMRTGDADRVAMLIARAGLVRVESMAAGDVVLVRSGPGQLHLGVWTGAGLVHADSHLRRVVERPGAVAWPVVGVFRGFFEAADPSPSSD